MQIVGEKYVASAFSKIMIYDPFLKESFPSTTHAWSKTILLKKDSVLINKTLLDEVELTRSLIAKKQLHVIDDMPFLYSSIVNLK